MLGQAVVKRINSDSVNFPMVEKDTFIIYKIKLRLNFKKH